MDNSETEEALRNMNLDYPLVPAVVTPVIVIHDTPIRLQQVPHSLSPSPMNHGPAADHVASAHLAVTKADVTEAATAKAVEAPPKIVNQEKQTLWKEQYPRIQDFKTAVLNCAVLGSGGLNVQVEDLHLMGRESSLKKLLLANEEYRERLRAKEAQLVSSDKLVDALGRERNDIAARTRTPLLEEIGNLKGLLCAARSAIQVVPDRMLLGFERCGQPLEHCHAMTAYHASESMKWTLAAIEKEETAEIAMRENEVEAVANSIQRDSRLMRRN